MDPLRMNLLEALKSERDRAAASRGKEVGITSTI